MQPFNPLDLENLGLSVLTAMTRQVPVSLDEIAAFDGAGVYAIYYTGAFAPYRLIAESNRDGRFEQPIYVGKAVPAGGRKGVAVSSHTRQLSVRLREHAKSVNFAENLDARDFSARYLVVEPIWIPLGESLMITRHAPLWNALLDGFGNHDPGAGRISGLRTIWDTVHPGRPWAAKYPERPQGADYYFNAAVEYLADESGDRPATPADE